MAKATGGTITHDGMYTIHTFTSNGTFTPSLSMSVSALVVGGGGGGGSLNYNASGGGGGGGVVYDSAHPVTAQAYSIVVGAGGVGVKDAEGNDGEDSTFDDKTAYGGGNGGYWGVGGNGGSDV